MNQNFLTLVKTISLLLAVVSGSISMAQETANRFIYELTYKPKKDSTTLDKELMVLDITASKSIYRNYTVVAQDSLMKAKFDAMQKAGAFDPDFFKKVKPQKFSYKIDKQYPSMKIQYSEMMIRPMAKPIAISYSETIKFDWKILPEKNKIGEYEVQKAVVKFGGRKWTAWFSAELPFQDGPYKFSGLPGLIVKIEDDGKNYSWVLKGNKKVSNYEELTFTEKMMGMTAPTEISKEKFEKTFNEYRKDPLGSLRSSMTPEMLDQKAPGSETTMRERIKDQEKMLDKLYNSIDNPIEIISEHTPIKK